MPFMYPTSLAATMLHRTFSFLPEKATTEIAMAYAHAAYANRSESLTDVDIVQIKWIIGVYLANAHILASEAIAIVLDEALS